MTAYKQEDLKKEALMKRKVKDDGEKGESSKTDKDKDGCFSF